MPARIVLKGVVIRDLLSRPQQWSPLPSWSTGVERRAPAPFLLKPSESTRQPARARIGRRNSRMRGGTHRRYPRFRGARTSSRPFRLTPSRRACRCSCPVRAAVAWRKRRNAIVTDTGQITNVSLQVCLNIRCERAEERESTSRLLRVFPSARAPAG